MAAHLQQTSAPRSSFPVVGALQPLVLAFSLPSCLHCSRCTGTFLKKLIADALLSEWLANAAGQPVAASETDSQDDYRAITRRSLRAAGRRSSAPSTRSLEGPPPPLLFGSTAIVSHPFPATSMMAFQYGAVSLLPCRMAQSGSMPSQTAHPFPLLQDSPKPAPALIKFRLRILTDRQRSRLLHFTTGISTHGAEGGCTQRSKSNHAW
jgi:hypothetical protein